MKRTILVVTAFGLVCNTLGLPALSAQDMTAGVDLSDPRYQKLVQEADRNRQMIEIWKDHVRTLTHERDEAYKKLETVQTTGVPVPAAAEAQVPDRSAELEALAAERDRATEEARSLRSRIAVLEDQAQRPDRSQKEVAELRADKDVILRDKERALSRIDVLDKQLADLRADNERLAARSASIPDPAMNQDLQANLKAQMERLREFSREKERLENELRDRATRMQELQAENGSLRKELAQKPATSAVVADDRALRQLKLENQALEARSQKLDIVETELQEARNYFASTMSDLETARKKLQADNARLTRQAEETGERASRGEEASKALESAQRRSAEFGSAVESLKKENQRLAAELSSSAQNASEHERALSRRIETLEKENSGLKTVQNDAAALRAEAERARSEARETRRLFDTAQGENTRLREEATALRAGAQELERTAVQRDQAARRSAELEAAYADQSAKLRAAETERDLSRKELEALRSQGEQLKTQIAAAQAIVREAEELRVSADSSEKAREDLLRQVQALKFQLEKTQAKNAQARQTEQELVREQAAHAAAQSRAAEFEKNLLAAEGKMRNALAAKEEAAQQLGALRAAVSAAESRSAALEEEIRKAGEIRRLSKEEKAEFTRQVQELAIENDALRARSEKLPLVENELAETRKYLSSVIQGLEQSNQTLSAENAALRSQKTEALERSRSIEASRRAAEQRAHDLDAELSLAKAELQKVQWLEEELARAQAVNKDLEGVGQENEELRRKLRSNAADLKNMKENLQALMEPLVEDFEDRK